MESGNEARLQMTAMLSALSFSQVLTVSKQRRAGRGLWEGRPIEVAVDELPSLGQFIELEMQASEADVPAARASLLRLAEQLQLTQPERRSYLELLLERDLSSSSPIE